MATKAHTQECADCHKQTSVTAGTVMHGSKLPLTVWLWAAYLMATHSNGISALQVHKQLGLGSYKSAWLLCAKLRRAMVAPERAPLAGLDAKDAVRRVHVAEALPRADIPGEMARDPRALRRLHRSSHEHRNDRPRTRSRLPRSSGSRTLARSDTRRGPCRRRA